MQITRLKKREHMGTFAPRVSDQIRPGFFVLRVERNGPLVPARIIMSVAADPVTGETLDRSPVLSATIDGMEADPWVVWDYGTEITREEYMGMLIGGDDEQRRD